MHNNKLTWCSFNVKKIIIVIIERQAFWRILVNLEILSSTQQNAWSESTWALFCSANMLSNYSPNKVYIQYPNVNKWIYMTGYINWKNSSREKTGETLTKLCNLDIYDDMIFQIYIHCFPFFLWPELIYWLCTCYRTYSSRIYI